MSDGGEGFLDCLPGRVHMAAVTGPLGDLVEAQFKLDGTTGFVEMSKASGIALVEVNDPVAASTYGTGELIAAAVDRGAKKVVVGLGGSATTDGGLGALRALESTRLRQRFELVVAVDVSTRFLDASTRFAPQKGASEAQIDFLSRRLQRLADMYLEEYRVDVTEVAGGGAAGGLAGGLFALGAELVSGFEVVGEVAGFFDASESARALVTGEGYVDAESFNGKVVGEVLGLGRAAEVPVVIVCGDFDPVVEELLGGAQVISLTKRFGVQRSMSDPLGCIDELAKELVSTLGDPTSM